MIITPWNYSCLLLNALNCGNVSSQYVKVCPKEIVLISTTSLHVSPQPYLTDISFPITSSLWNRAPDLYHSSSCPSSTLLTDIPFPNTWSQWNCVLDLDHTSSCLSSNLFNGHSLSHSDIPNALETPMLSRVPNIQDYRPPPHNSNFPTSILTSQVGNKPSWTSCNDPNNFSSQHPLPRCPWTFLDKFPSNNLLQVSKCLQ